MPNKLVPFGLGKFALLFALTLLVSPGTSAFAQAADAPSRLHPKDQAAKEASKSAPQNQADARRQRSRDRPPPESGRPFIGPRTTQGLAEDAIARSAPR
jgi:hypothetical protein